MVSRQSSVCHLLLVTSEQLLTFLLGPFHERGDFALREPRLGVNQPIVPGRHLIFLENLTHLFQKMTSFAGVVAFPLGKVHTSTPSFDIIGDQPGERRYT